MLNYLKFNHIILINIQYDRVYASPSTLDSQKNDILGLYGLLCAVNSLQL